MSGQIKLSDWKIFEVLAEKGSFRKASDDLELDSANIKRSLDRLESALNLKLFSRSPRGVKLTEEGKLYQFKIKELMAPLELQPTRSRRRKVSIEYDAKLSFARVLLLLGRYNQIDPSLIFDCSDTENKAKDFLSIQLHPGKDLQGFRRSAVVSSRLLSSKSKPITFKQLSEFPYIALSRDFDSESLGGLKPALIVKDADEAVRAAALGLGFCLVFSENSLLKLVTAGSLIFLPIELPEKPCHPEIHSSVKDLADFVQLHRNLLLTQ